MNALAQMPTMPLFWPEKLDLLEVGGSEPIENETELGTAQSAKLRIMKRTAKEFKVRTNKETGKTRIYRTK